MGRLPGDCGPTRRWPEHLGTKGLSCVICLLPALELRYSQPA
jgi:hypothetical protein